MLLGRKCPNALTGLLGECITDAKKNSIDDKKHWMPTTQPCSSSTSCRFRDALARTAAPSMGSMVKLCSWDTSLLPKSPWSRTKGRLNKQNLSLHLDDFCDYLCIQKSALKPYTWRRIPKNVHIVGGVPVVPAPASNSNIADLYVDKSQF